MHGEHIERAVSTASQGSNVVVFAETLNQAQDIARQIEDAAPKELLKRVSRLNGDHRIEFHGGGRIFFRSTHLNARGVRGMSLDRVFVPIGSRPRILEEIIPALATSSEAVLTGY